MKNNFKSGLQKALDELENITPLKPFNCGKLCSARCCCGGDNDGMGLFPGVIQMKNELSQIISQSRSLVFFGGAGVSTESGIPDFRSVDGLYNQKYDYPPEQMLSHTFFERKTEDFYRFYRDKILSYAVSAKPNAAHRKLAELEEKGVLSAVVTQNIDGLHQAAGSKNVFELHGSVDRKSTRLNSSHT